MRLLFPFLDGVGLGADDPQRNPFARAPMPNLERLLGGNKLVNGVNGAAEERATLLALDACLDVEGLPQSASGQATLLTGVNVPALLGEHFGPKPNRQIQALLGNGNLFRSFKENSLRASLLNAYPEAYFRGLDSGKRLPGAIAMAARLAGLPLMTADDLFEGKALSADFTGKAWLERLGYPQAPVLSFDQAGRRLAALAAEYELAFFEFWISDVLGHRRDMEAAIAWLKRFDQVLGGLLDAWDDSQGVILLTSDHGNLEDLTTRRHTANPVPALLIGAPDLRQSFARQLHDLTDITPSILELFGLSK